MEQQKDNIPLYELLSYIEDIEIPNEFHSMLDEYILGLSNGHALAQTIAIMLKQATTDAIGEFMDAIESHMLEVMMDAFTVVDSQMAENKRIYLYRLMIHYRYKNG